MAPLINFTTLFGINPAKSTPLSNPINFRGSENINAFNFGVQEGYKDRFAANPIKANFKSKAEIEQLAKSSPRIMALLKEYNLPLRVNMEAIEDMR